MMRLSKLIIPIVVVLFALTYANSVFAYNYNGGEVYFTATSTMVQLYPDGDGNFTLPQSYNRQEHNYKPSPSGQDTQITNSNKNRNVYTDISAIGLVGTNILNATDEYIIFTHYNFSGGNTCGVVNGNVISNTTGSTCYWMLLRLNSGSIVEGFDVSSTTIYSFSPAYASTTATTTVSLKTVYNLIEDDAIGLYCDLSNCGQLYVSWNIGNMDTNSSMMTFNTPIASLTGTGTTSKTVNLTPGFYAGIVSINNGSTNLTYREVRFVVVSTNFSSTEIEGLTATTTVTNINYCKGLNFFSLDCMRQLFVINQTQGQDINDRFFSLIENKPPLSWMYRAYDLIATTTASTTIPSISYTFASTSPLSGQTIAFNPWQYGYNHEDAPLRTIVDPSTGKNIWDIMEDVITYIVWIVVVFKIVNDITKIHVADKQNL